MTWPVISHGSRWKEDLPNTPWRWALWPAWAVYRPLVALRGIAYDHGLRPVHRVAAPVIAIGNVIAGGTGKTPAARTVCRLLSELGRRPMVVSRGYRGSGGVNDEAHLFGTFSVVCNPDRVAGGKTAIDQGADCLVLDDGFQHRRLHRDLDIVLIDATRPWGAPRGRGAVLPLGYLRESRAALQRAGLIWLSRTDLVQPESLSALRGELATLLQRPVPIVEEILDTATFRPLVAGEPVLAQAFAGRAVIAVSGIGHPTGFEQQLARLGCTVVEAHRFPDHHHYDGAELAELQRRAEANGAVLLMTAKDAVKCRGLRNDLPAWVLDPTYRFAGDGLERLTGILREVVGAWKPEPTVVAGQR